MFEFILQVDPMTVYGNLLTSVLTTVGIVTPLVIAVIKKVDKDGKNRVVDVLEQQVLPIQEALVEKSAAIKQGMQVVYEMQPEEAKKIINKPAVRLQKLQEDLDKENAKLVELKKVIDTF